LREVEKYPSIVGFEPGTMALIAIVLTNFAKRTFSPGLKKLKYLLRRHFHSASIAVSAFRALEVYPRKIATPRIEYGSVALLLAYSALQPLDHTTPQLIAINFAIK